MILSFHPCFKTDKNIVCPANRPPNEKDLKEIKKANIIILPQGCSKKLYVAVRKNCVNVFPNFDAKFLYPGKIGQIKLFQTKKAPHPNSWCYKSVHEFTKGQNLNLFSTKHKLPFILKFNWGGEGETVFLIKTKKNLVKILNTAINFEQTGFSGFLIQEYLKSQQRTLRITIIGETIIAYWKIQSNPKNFGSNLKNGAYINKKVDQIYRKNAISVTKKFCTKTNINLAGLDLIFHNKNPKPIFLEINYFFGRKGLGGSNRYYTILCKEIKKWIKRINITNHT